MIYPILGYSNSILRKKSYNIKKNTNLNSIINNMFQTMNNANGIGIAAPQIGKNIKLFIININQYYNNNFYNYKKIFINPIIIKKYGKIINQKEGCLSIPNVLINISRKEKIKVRYFNEKWDKKEQKFNGIISRIIQHEYDHLNGVLHIDYIKNEKKKIIKNKLLRIKKKIIKTNYNMIF